MFSDATWYDTDEAGAIDLRAGMEIDPAPQGKLKKVNVDRDDERFLIFSTCFWNFDAMDHDSFAFINFTTHIICFYSHALEQALLWARFQRFLSSWSTIWQLRAQRYWLVLKVRVIYSEPCEPEARGDEYDLSGFWKENWFSSCETSTEKWNSGRVQWEKKKMGDENSISFLCHRNSSVLVKTAVLTRQWISFKCLCAKASKGNINTP